MYVMLVDEGVPRMSPERKPWQPSLLDRVLTVSAARLPQAAPARNKRTGERVMLLEERAS